jgi:sugar/nucleoside kinase (ribokinase family)
LGVAQTVTILVTGTLAIDHIATVADGFAAGDLNGKLARPETHWGGCGMNLTYALQRQGISNLPWIFYGDNSPSGYQTHLKNLSIDQRAMHQQENTDCACAYIFTRPDGSQLTGFYPGESEFEPPSVATLAALAACEHWIAGPEDDATLLARLEHIPSNIELYWMPGQYADVTRNNVLEPMLARVPHLIVNETEWQTLNHSVGEKALSETVRSVFITRGSSGVRYRTARNEDWRQRDTTSAKVIDPTGCGDAFCATLVGQLVSGASVTQAIDLAQATAALCLAKPGAQNY